MDGEKRPGDPPVSASLMATPAASQTNPNPNPTPTPISSNISANASTTPAPPQLQQPHHESQRAPSLLSQPLQTFPGSHPLASTTQAQPKPLDSPSTTTNPTLQQPFLQSHSPQPSLMTAPSSQPFPSASTASSSMQTPAPAPSQPALSMATGPKASSSPLAQSPTSASPVTLPKPTAPAISSMSSGSGSGLQATAAPASGPGVSHANAAEETVGTVVDETTANSKRRLLELGLTDADIKIARSRLDGIIKEVDSSASLDPEVEEILIRLSLRFLERTTNAACQLAVHRGSSEVELADLRLYVEKTLGIKVPGFGLSDCSNISPSLLDKTRETGHPAKPTDTHLRRLHLKRKAHALVPEE